MRWRIEAQPPPGHFTKDTPTRKGSERGFGDAKRTACRKLVMTDNIMSISVSTYNIATYVRSQDDGYTPCQKGARQGHRHETDLLRACAVAGLYVNRPILEQLSTSDCENGSSAQN